ncbi:POTRA domain-containing protein, partial [Veillonella caviae]|uniref:POTRA domain-containing protein n=1 Tax=Veillonella caviae TaxID=248316 RepID=UPI002A8247AB
MDLRKHVLLSMGMLGLSVLAVPYVHATDPIFPITQQEQLQQDRLRQWEREHRLSSSQERPLDNIVVPIDVPSDENGTSFYVSKIELDGLPKELSFLQSVARQAEDKKMTVADITNVRNELQRQLINTGYVTTQVFIPEQNLSSGTLQFLVVPGHVEDVVYSSESKHIPW